FVRRYVCPNVARPRAAHSRIARDPALVSPVTSPLGEYMLAHPVAVVLWNHKAVEDMFYIFVPFLEKVLRPILVYVFLVISLRIFGKRELTNINPFDFVVLLTLSNTVQNAIIGEDNSISGGIIGATTLLVTNYFV